MIYYLPGMELEVVSMRFRGRVNSVAVCRDRLSASGVLYTLWIVHDRACARTLLGVMEGSNRGLKSPCLMQAAQNEELLFLFPYREERKFSSFAGGQRVTEAVGEEIAIQLVLECISVGFPWPILYLILEQDQVQIAKDNSVYFNVNLDLEQLDPEKTERSCVSKCAWMILDLMSSPLAGRQEAKGGWRGKQRLKSFLLIRKKSAKHAYASFPELYHDIRLTALPARKTSLKNRLKGVWLRNRDWLFRLLLVLCGVLVAVALAMLITQIIFGEIPWLRLFQNTFDVIGTENLHQGGRT